MFNYIYNRFFELSSPYLDTGMQKVYYKSRFLRILNYFNSENKKNKYFLVDILVETYFLLLYPIFFPVAIFLYINKYRIYIIDNKSFGDFIWEMAVITNDVKKEKILIPVNLNFNFEIYQKILFSKIIIIKIKILSHILLILNNYNFLRFNIFNKKVIIEPKHYINYENPIKSYKNLKEYLIAKKLKNINFKYKKLNFKKIKDFNFRLKNSKLAIINPRYVVGRNDEIRNSKISIFLKSINYLKSKNYLIFIFGNNKKFKNFCNTHKIEYINLKKNVNKLKQVCSFYHCDIYMGSYSGMAHLTDLFKNKCIYTDEVFYNSIIANENCIVLPKKIKIKNKTLPYNHKKYYQFSNINRNKHIQKNMSFINVSELDVLKALKIALRKKKISTSNKKKINISFDFIKKNTIIKI